MVRRLCALIVALLAISAGGLAVGGPALADSASPVTVNDITVLKPTTGTTNLVFTVRLTYPSLNTVTVQYATQDGTAHANIDYSPEAGSVVFAPGSTTKTVSVPALGSTLDSGNKSFTLSLSSAVNGTIARGSGTGTIIDDTPAPWINVADATLAVGSAGTGTASFAVSLSSASTNTVKVHYATSDYTARAGLNYTAESGTLTFSPGVTTQTVTVPVRGGTPPEQASEFLLTIGTPVNATVQRNQAVALIVNNDRTGYFTVDDAIVAKPSSGTTTTNVAVRLVAPATIPVSVNYATADGSAVAGTDYTATFGTLTFPAGTTSLNVPITIAGNAAANPLRTFSLNLSSPSAGSAELRGSGAVAIRSTGNASQLTLKDASVTKTDSGTATLNFTVVLSPASTSTVTVTYATANGSAVTPADYTAKNGTLTFSPGVTSQVVGVTIPGNTLLKNDDYLSLNLSSPSGATILRGSAYGEILNQEATPYLSLRAADQVLPTSGTSNEVFTVTLSAPSPNTVTVNYQTSDGSAVSSTDYVATAGTLTFNPGVTSLPVNVPIVGSTVPGANKYFQLNLSAATNAVLQSSYNTAEILNRNYPPTLSVGDTSAYRPLTGTATVSFPVSLSSASPNTVTVHYATSDGSAAAGSAYVATSGTLTFAPGVTSQSVAVTTEGSTSDTANRYFYLSISTATNATIVSSYATASIVNDVVTPFLSVTAPAVVAGASATHATATVSLSSASFNTVTVNYSTSDSSAVAGTDYTATSGTLTFTPGQTSQSISIPVAANTTQAADQDKAFYLSLASAVNAVISTSYVAVPIVYGNAVPALSVGDVTVNRQTTGTRNATFVVTLTPAGTKTVTVNYSTSNGSAVAGTDYTATTGTLTFSPGVTSQSVNVAITPITSSTPDRSFYLSLASPVASQVLRTSAEAIIVDTVAPTSGKSYLTVSDQTLVAPSSGTSTATFTVNLTPAAPTPVTVGYTTADYSAVAGIDYTPVRGTLTFAAGQTAQTIAVPVAGQDLAHVQRSFVVNLSGNTGPSLFLRSQGTGLIQDTVPTSRLSVGPDIAVIRGDSGTKSLTFTVNLSPAQAEPVQVDYYTQDYTAISPRDYLGDTGTLVFAPGQTTQSVTITVNAETSVDPTRLFLFNVDNPVGSSVNRNSAEGNIYNADVFSITGTVTDPTGAAIAGATVTRTGNNQATATATTNSSGVFTIPNSLGGSYTLTPKLAGRNFNPTSTGVTVRGGPSTGNVFIGFTGVGLAGRIVTSTGSGLAGATVNRTGGAQASATRTSNALGYYVFDNVPNGTGYVVTSAATGYTTTLPASYTESVTGTTVSGLDLLEVQAPFIAGRILGAGSVPVVGVTVTRSGGGQATVTVRTDSQGYYAFPLVPATAGGTTYTITPTATGHTFTPTSATATVSTTVNAPAVNFTES